MNVQKFFLRQKSDMDFVAIRRELDRYWIELKDNFLLKTAVQFIQITFGNIKKLAILRNL
jgi:hypothetical protein